MSVTKKETFKLTKELEGKTKEVEFAVVSPNPEHGRIAQRVYNKTLADGLKAGGLLRRNVLAHMKEQNLWGDKQEKEQVAIVTEINEIELKLQKGGFKLSDARGDALKIRELRVKLRDLFAERNSLDTNSVEGQAENARFNALVSLCLVYNDTGKPVYSDLDDYLSNGDQPEAFQGAQTLASMLYELDKNFDASLAENKFLRKWKFVDEELRLVNKDGQLVDTEGRLINEMGHFVNESGDLVDRDGNRVDKDGNYLAETSPFLDDEGNEIVEEAPEEEAETSSEDSETPAES